MGQAAQHPSLHLMMLDGVDIALAKHEPFVMA